MRRVWSSRATGLTVLIMRGLVKNRVRGVTGLTKRWAWAGFEHSTSRPAPTTMVNRLINENITCLRILRESVPFRQDVLSLVTELLLTCRGGSLLGRARGCGSNSGEVDHGKAAGGYVCFAVLFD